MGSQSRKSALKDRQHRGDWQVAGATHLYPCRTSHAPLYIREYMSYITEFCLSMALQPFVGPWPLFQFLDLFTQSVGLLGRGISPSQG
jgi:hypothetical protein